MGRDDKKERPRSRERDKRSERKDGKERERDRDGKDRDRDPKRTSAPAAPAKTEPRKNKFEDKKAESPPPPPPKKTWSFEDEDDEDEGKDASLQPMDLNADLEEEEVDALDMYMASIEQEVDTTVGTKWRKNHTLRGVPIETRKNTKDEDNYKQAFLDSLTKIQVKEIDPEKIGRENDDPLPAGDGPGGESKEESDMYYDKDGDWVWGAEDQGPKTFARILKDVDHKDLYADGTYRDFRKRFFVVTDDMRNLTKKEIKKIRLDNDNTKVKDPQKVCPPPVTTWQQCGLPDQVIKELIKNNCFLPFAIQAQAIPAIMSGHDVIGCACTGSGKTLSYLLPMIRHILDQPKLAETDGPIALIMCPTRELAVQIAKDATKYISVVGLKACVCYGGAPIASQIADLKRLPEIIVATPGRMIDMLLANKGKVTNLHRVTYVVFDEADRMFDMGFGPQIERIVGNTRPDRQTVMFSATFPKQVEAAAHQFLKNPLEITIGARSIAATNVTQYVEFFDDEQVKFLRLLQLLGIWIEKGLILVFVDTQAECDELYKDLFAAGYSEHVASLHGGMLQSDREDALQDFKTHERQILVATSVAARGLDIIDLEIVINYKCPDHYEDYVHRVGRTGRAGKKGTAYTFMMRREQDDRMAQEVARALESSNNIVPEELAQRAGAAWQTDKMQLTLFERKSSRGYRGKGHKWNTDEAKKKREEIKKQAWSMGLAYELSGSEDERLDEDDAEAQKMACDTARTVAGNQIGWKDKQNMNLQKVVTGAKAYAQGLTHTLKMKEDREKQGKFQMEIEINDYPQSVRQNLTYKSVHREIGDQFHCEISTKGFYTAKGVRVEQGTRKLYLLIEGHGELEVKACKDEIERRISDKMSDLSSRGFLGGGERSAFGNISSKNYNIKLLS